MYFHAKFHAHSSNLTELWSFKLLKLGNVRTYVRTLVTTESSSKSDEVELAKKCTCAPAISISYLFYFPQSNKIKLGRGFRDFETCSFLFRKFRFRIF